MIEEDRVFTKNSNLPHGHGELQLMKFESFPKNTPMFIEDNIFEIVILMGNVATLQVDPENTDKETGKETNKETSERIMDIMREILEISVKEISQIMDIWWWC